MYKSNIVAGSNVFHSYDEDPRFDEYFVKQVQDYPRLKGIVERQLYDKRIASLDDVQLEILRTEMRCVYAENDPCWGYMASTKKIVSACIQGECPQIRKCNPQYSEKYASCWKMTKKEQDLYGDPSELRSFYKVDMISDEEMLRYGVYPQNDGFEYPMIKNPVPKEKKPEKNKNPKTRINPLTGQREVVVGYRWVITDNASYENEELYPIWGVVEEAKKIVVPSRRKTARIAKKIEEEQIPIVGVQKIAIKNLEEEIRDCEAKVLAKEIIEIKVTGLEENSLNQGKYLVISDNPAEMAYISSILLVNGINHGTTEECGVRLILLDDFMSIKEKRTVIITNAAIKVGCSQSRLSAWQKLSKEDKLFIAVLPNREYYKFKKTASCSRWCCRNFYGVTHVCMLGEDIELFGQLSEETYTVYLLENDNGYVLETGGGVTLGKAKASFVEMLTELFRSGEIESMPASIDGIALSWRDGKLCIYGMGHLRFLEY